MRIGLGEDIHRLVSGRDLLIGGVKIESDAGEKAHSDGDVLLHAIADAIYGAIADGDLGTHFPDDDSKTENMDSGLILKDAIISAKEKGYELSSLDSNIFLENIKLKPHIESIRKSLARLCDISIESISVKARTNEGLGPVGEGLAIRANVIVLLKEVSND